MRAAWHSMTWLAVQSKSRTKDHAYQSPQESGTEALGLVALLVARLVARLVAWCMLAARAGQGWPGPGPCLRTRRDAISTRLAACSPHIEACPVQVWWLGALLGPEVNGDTQTYSSGHHVPADSSSFTVTFEFGHTDV